MISPMDKITLVGSKGKVNDVLASLQSLGVVQIEPLHFESLDKFSLQDDEALLKERWDKLANKSSSLLNVLTIDELTPVSKLEDTDIASLEPQFNNLDRQVDALVAEKQAMLDELEVINTYLPPFRQVASNLARLEDSHYLAGRAFVVPNEEAVQTFKASALKTMPALLLFEKPYGKEWLITAAMLKKDLASFTNLLGEAGYAALALPESYAEHGTAKAIHIMEERLQSIPQRLETINAELERISSQKAGILQAVNKTAKNQQKRFEVLTNLVQSKYSFALQGWLPSQNSQKVVTALKKSYPKDVIIETRSADEHSDKDIPVQLENPNWIKPFEGLLSLFAPPKYGSFDPSWTLATFFPFFFGLVIGDIGFSLLFLVIGLSLRARGKANKKLSLGLLGLTIKPTALLPIGTVINWCALWGVLWGILYGEFFGNFLEHWPQAKPIFYTPLHSDNGFIPIVLFRVEQFTPLLLLSLGFGILQVLGGWFIRAYYGHKHHDRKHFWEGIGMFSGLLALVIFATAFLQNGLNAAVQTIVIACFAVFIFAVFSSRMPLMLIELISNGGNILSYLRLFAVGLSAALVANLATDLGFAINSSLPIIGPVIGILVGLCVHLITLVLTIIGHTLQPLRLHYVEFFTKFGFYDENGRPYQPFNLSGGR